MKKILLLIIILAKLTPMMAQDKGVRFADLSSWEEVLSQAKADRKAVFVDFYTTWCGPCKLMDQETYPDANTGTFMNKNFVSIKVQMDSTAKDSPQIRKWYKEAQKLGAKYHIGSYPTLLFLDTNGRIQNRYTGFQNATGLLNSARKALASGGNYSDALGRLAAALKLRRNGGINDDNLYELINLSIEAKQEKLADSLSAIYLSHLRKLDRKQLYRPEILKFLWDAPLKVGDPLLRLFWPDGFQSDKIVAEKGFSNLVLHRAIQRSFLNDSLLKAAVSIKSINLDSTAVSIAEIFGKRTAQDALLLAKLRWYDLHRKQVADDNFTSYFVQVLDKLGPNALTVYGYWWPQLPRYRDTPVVISTLINAVCWESIFKKSEDPKLIAWGLKWLGYVVELKARSEDFYRHHRLLDTYANLIYKSGAVEKALKTEQQALTFAKMAGTSQAQISGYELTIQKMKDGQPTWPSAKQKP